MRLKFYSSMAIAILLVLLISKMVHGQTPLTAPQVAGCPSPTPYPVAGVTTGWPGSACKYQFYPLSDTAHAIASASKSTPVYAHTYGGYVGAKYSGTLVACPIGATLSADSKSCSDASGKDASALVTLANLPTFSIAAVTPPPVPTPVPTPTPPPPEANSLSVTVTLAGSGGNPLPAAVYSNIAPGACFVWNDGTHSGQFCLPK
jgi:hypothetical protein